MLRIGPGAAAVKGAGPLVNLKFQVLRGDTTESPLAIRLSGVSAGCFTSIVDSGRLFQLTAECASQLRLIHLGRRTLLRPISPNPVGDIVKIDYDVPVTGRTAILLYDVSGRMVRRIIDADCNAGAASIELDTRQLAPGLYYCRISVGKDFSETTPMVIAR